MSDNLTSKVVKIGGRGNNKSVALTVRWPEADARSRFQAAQGSRFQFSRGGF